MSPRKPTQPSALRSTQQVRAKPASELILFTPDFGTSTELGPGVEVVLDSSGRVVKLRKSRGGPIPEDGSVLSGTGEAADWLLAHARPGRTINFTMSITAYGAPLAPGVSYAACA
jgi:hypothetical protein